jgi:hypothetical protein
LPPPDVAKPPMFDRWGLGPGRADRRDQREYARRRIKCDLWLIDGASQAVLRCKTNDIADAGLHATAPIGFGLAVGQRFGYIDRNGIEVIEPRLQWAGDFSGGLAPFAVDEQYGYIDRSGTIVIPPEYDFAEPFRDGLGRVSYLHPDGGADFGYVDVSGSLVWKPTS